MGELLLSLALLAAVLAGAVTWARRQGLEWRSDRRRRRGLRPTGGANR